MFNEGKFVHHEDGKGGHYYLDNDKRQDVTYDELKNLKDLEKYIALKGKAHDFAYKHGIGNYFSKQDGSALTMDDIYDRCNMLKNAAHYDEDNFFWLQYAPNSEYVMSQIRISNHIADINQWKKTHSDPSNIKCDIGLSIVIDKQEIRATAQAKERELYTQDVDYKIGVLEVEMNWDDKNFEDRAFVENFLQALTEGKQPKLSYNEILKYFCDIGEPHFISYLRSGSNIRRHNFQTRDNIKKVRKYQEREIAREKEKLKKQKENLERQKAREMSAMLEIPSTIKFDDIFDKVDSKTNTFVLGQRNYVLHTDGEGYYACPVKTRRGITYEDDKYKIPITENKNFMIRKKLVNMITESIIKNILMEGTNMQALYHFTTKEKLVNIANKNALWLNGEEMYIRNNNFFASLTRNKGLQGFGEVRIQFNAQKLNTIHNVKIVPFNFFHAVNKKYENRFAFNRRDAFDEYDRLNYNETDEKEDRFLSDGRSNKECEEALISKSRTAIPNIDNYIERIDILCSSYDKDTLRKLYKSIKNDSMKSKIFIYNDKYSFWRQNDNCYSFVNFINLRKNNFRQVSENKKLIYYGM